ncbi:hypothetical protein [Actinomadura gamaensis]|uniref:Uncharacterized protein n=1 Tax=Actinomadura gamaensis TaxID=1763541 RepID=A0ABV9U3H5_9ACTN
MRAYVTCSWEAHVIDHGPEALERSGRQVTTPVDNSMLHRPIDLAPAAASHVRQVIAELTP